MKNFPGCSNARMRDDHRIRGQNALVTGANSGIGEAVAISLGQAGANGGLSHYFAGDERTRKW